MHTFTLFYTLSFFSHRNRNKINKKGRYSLNKKPFQSSILNIKATESEKSISYFLYHIIPVLFTDSFVQSFLAFFLLFWYNFRKFHIFNLIFYLFCILNHKFEKIYISVTKAAVETEKRIHLLLL